MKIKDNDARALLKVYKKVDEEQELEGEEKLKAKLLLNRGYLKLEQTGPNFGQVKYALTEKSKPFRQLYKR